MMKTSQRTILSLFFIVVLTFSLTVPASARASDYFVDKKLSASSAGNGTLKLTLDISATETMQELGASQIRVYEKQSNGISKVVYTFYRASYPKLIVKNKSSIVVDVTYRGIPGKIYYATANCYAKNSKGSNSMWVDSHSVRV
ncbi:MAG: hypothetical protein MR286_10675 [Clostridiales bacterium]|nr:hypothetical protein [Clostridiales bacterium]